MYIHVQTSDDTLTNLVIPGNYTEWLLLIFHKCAKKKYVVQYMKPLSVNDIATWQICYPRRDSESAQQDIKH